MQLDKKVCFLTITRKQITFTLVSEIELCLLKGASGMGLLEDGCDLLEVVDSVGRDLGDALLA